MENKLITKNSVVEMRNMSASEINSLINEDFEGVHLLGYYTKGDKPGVVYNWSPNITEVDNGGNIIAVSNQASGRLISTLNDMVLIEDFGAKPNDSSFNNSQAYIRACTIGFNDLGKNVSFLTSGDYYFANVSRVPIRGTRAAYLNGNGATIKVQDSVFSPSNMEPWFLDFVAGTGNVNESQLYVRNLNLDGQMNFVYPTSGSIGNIKRLSAIRVSNGFTKITFEDVNIKNVQGRGFFIDQSYNLVNFTNCKLKNVGGKYNNTSNHDTYDSFGDGIYLGQSMENFNPQFSRPKIYIDNCSIESPYMNAVNSANSYLSRLGVCVETFNMPSTLNYRITLFVTNSHIAGYDRGIHFEGGGGHELNADLNISNSILEWNNTNFLSAGTKRPIVRIDNSSLINTAVVKANVPAATLGSTFGEFGSIYGNEIYLSNSRVEFGKNGDTIRVNGNSIFRATSCTLDFKGRSSRFISDANGVPQPEIEFINSEILGVHAPEDLSKYSMFDTGAGKISFVSTKVVGALTANRGSANADNTPGFIRAIGSRFEFVFQNSTFEDIRLHFDFTAGYNRVAATLLRFSNCTWIRNARGTAPRLSGSFHNSLMFFGSYRFVYFDSCTFRQYVNPGETASKDSADALYDLYNVPNPISFSRSIRYFGVHSSNFNNPIAVAGGFQRDANIIN